MIPKEQSWFWSKKWQQGEKEAQHELDGKGPGRAYTAKELLSETKLTSLSDGTNRRCPMSGKKVRRRRQMERAQALCFSRKGTLFGILKPKTAVAPANMYKLRTAMANEIARQTVMERIEDECDLKFYEKAMAEHQANPVVFSHDDVRKMLEMPNATTISTFEATDRDEGLIRCKDAEDMFQKLKI